MLNNDLKFKNAEKCGLCGKELIDSVQIFLKDNKTEYMFICEECWLKLPTEEEYETV